MYGMAVSVATFMVASTMIILELSEAPLHANVQRAILMSVTLVWGGATLWLTFMGLFQNAGNGYFALWVGLYFVSELTVDVQGRIASAFNQNETLISEWGQFVAALVVIIAVSGLHPEVDLWGYALSVGIVSAVFSAIGALTMESTQFKTRLFDIGKTPVSPNDLMAWFLFVWWGFGACFMTMWSPFLTTANANGYFATWLGFLCSFVGIGVDSTRIKAAVSTGMAAHALLFWCSFVVDVELISILVNDPDRFLDHEAEIIWALVVAFHTFAYAFFNCGGRDIEAHAQMLKDLR